MYRIDTIYDSEGAVWFEISKRFLFRWWKVKCIGHTLKFDSYNQAQAYINKL
jgi:hypothetical protein